jgi:hypothetical protein
MNVLTITGIVVILTLLFGALLALLFRGASGAVDNVQEEMERDRASRKPQLTQGHPLPVDAAFDVQLKQARKLAAKRAARLPRWGNFHIQGRNEVIKAPSAFQGIEQDPITAVKIAQYHTWAGLTTGGQTATQAAPQAAAAAAVAAPTKSPDDLKPGVDYPVIEITDDMDPAEVRKARIANAKARSAAVKALKQAPAAAAAAAPAAAPTAAPQVREPQPGVDYPVIEITDDMDPADVRKARIANAKARSAAMKAFKESGGAEATTPAAGAAPAATAAPAPAAGAAQEPQPGVDYEVIEITDDMPPDEVRKARIANAKARSAAMKAFKATGGGAAATQAAPVPQPAPEAAPQVATAPPVGAPPPPEYIEITDDMEPADVRKARIANAKMRSAYAKALKEAGIDPSTVL